MRSAEQSSCPWTQTIKREERDVATCGDYCTYPHTLRASRGPYCRWRRRRLVAVLRTRGTRWRARRLCTSILLASSLSWPPRSRLTHLRIRSFPARSFQERAVSGQPILEPPTLTAPKLAPRTTPPTAVTVSMLVPLRRLRIRGSRRSLEKERAWSGQPAGRTTSAMARRAATLPAALRPRPLARTQRRAARQSPNSAAAASLRLSNPLLAPQPAPL